jgi:hypothetical protein
MNMGEIAEASNVSLSVVRRWVAAGYLKPVELPLLTRRKLFRVDDVRAFVASCLNAGDDDRPTFQAIAQDYEGQIGYLLRRCLAAEGNEGDVAAMEALIADAEDVGRL